MASPLTECLQEEAHAINNASKHLSTEEVNHALTLVDNCFEDKSKLIISGVGKSGIVARKMAATFSSVGVMAIYLNPLDALHGDLGVIHRTDVCLFLSNSGETEELLEIMPHIKRRGLKTIALVGDSHSSLAKESDIVLEAKIDKEACPLNLAPTASTTVAMAIGDAIATVWMRRKGISSEDFAVNHPAGALGKRISLNVADLMIPTEKLHFLLPTDNFEQIIKVITKDGIGTGCVQHPEENGKLIGVITDGDVRRGIENNSSDNWASLSAQDLMTKDPIVIAPFKLAIEALEIMEKSKKLISVLPVVSYGNLLGIIRLHDLIQAGLK